MPKNRKELSDLTIEGLRGRYAALSYGEIAQEMKNRYGVEISRARVQQICQQAERKLRKALEGFNGY